MFESFVIMLREGVEAALVIGILLVVLERTARRDLKHVVYWGLGLAILASIGGAMLLSLLPASEEIYEGTLYLTSALFVASMMVWMHRKARTLKGDIEAHAARAMSGSHWREKLGLAAFAFFMVFREGAEAVMFLAAVNLTTSAVLSFLGALAGLAFAVIFCVMFVRGSLPVNLRRFFLVTEYVLAIFLVQLVINGYHEFAEVALLPANATSMAVIGPVVRNNTLFLLAMVTLPLILYFTRQAETTTAQAETGGAAARRIFAKARRERNYRLSAAACAVIVLAAVGIVYARELAPKELSPPEMIEPQGNDVVIQTMHLKDGKLHRFGYLSATTLVRFLAITTADGKTRTAFDACEICGDKGYTQENDFLICLNCAAAIEPATLGIPGGCNPIPLESETSSEYVRIPVRTLDSMSSMFHSQPDVEQIDPVCGMRVRMHEAVAFESHNSRIYYFCAERCAERFRENPEAFTE